MTFQLEIDTRDIDNFERHIKTIQKLLPKERAELHREVGENMLEFIRQRIPHRTGKIAGWQQMYLGSGGGYAAVRPTNQAQWFGNRLYSATGDNSPGAITQALETGHVRSPEKELSKKYRRKLRDILKAKYIENNNWVEGKFFYAEAKKTAPTLAIARTQMYIQSIAHKLEDF